ncbi:hypothetical protein QBC33DRAFT_510847 [Phialemonium atrogriseum]|uniref:Uncharacterized protein n=1 Tax=Phialemonium atrogriseum TaxID=1093897 RepID=A0AAJ0C9X2_9PEZI|nr:uncharacterized protein QBC33DRAFT_510847 [Phialemonium atrogriseum]KAK1771319.1 hypothetical protein QBC33DRAFT_510847 [Phialemonium atrogriseum]
MATSTISELDLSACHPSSIADKFNAVPGLKPSAAFFTFLRANLVLPPSAMSSNVSTPSLEPTTSQTMTQPAVSQLLTDDTQRGAIGVDDDIPPLSLDVLATRDDKVAALKLVADSIAQQRQQASRSLIFHPLCLSVLAAALAGAYQFAWARRNADLGLTVTMFCGVATCYLLAARYLAGPYVQLAEDVRWDFLTAGGDGATSAEEDVVIGTRYGDEIVGALVLRLEPNPAAAAAAAAAGTGTGGRKKGRGPGAQTLLKGGRGVIRAWTTRLRYRGRGVGGDMLREAVRVTRERCGRDAEVGFAKEHANSVMVLPDMFNGAFRGGEVRAARALEAVLADWDRSRRKR